MLAIGNEELHENATVHIGDRVICPHCEVSHKLQAGTDAETGKQSHMIYYYKCGDKSYIGAVGKKLMSNLRRTEDGNS